MKPETCTAEGCGEEIRHGWRDGVKGWWHREPVDHTPIMGRRFTADERDEVVRQKHLPRERTVTRKIKGESVEITETYTVAGLEREALLKTAKGRERVAIEDEADDEEHEPENPLEPVEVRSFPMPLKGDFDAPRVDGGTQRATVPGGCRTVLNLAAKQGWDVVRLTYARGPYLGSKGGSLGVSDSVRLIVSGPVVDDHRLYGVASWRDGKSDWAWCVWHGKTQNSTVTALKDLMKGHPA